MNVQLRKNVLEAEITCLENLWVTTFVSANHHDLKPIHDCIKSLRQELEDLEKIKPNSPMIVQKGEHLFQSGLLSTELFDRGQPGWFV